MMQPSDDDASTAHSTHRRDSENSKSSVYRAMVSRGEPPAWRGAARSKVAAGIGERASSDQSSAIGHDTIPVSEHNVIQQYMEDLDLDEQAPSETHKTAENESPGVSSSEDMSEMSEEKAMAADNEKENQGEVVEKEEPEIPVIYKNWEPKPEDEETELEDVELGGELELQNHIGEVDLDKGAFERLRALEVKEKERRRRERIFMALSAVVTFVFLFAIISLIVALVSKPSSSSNNDQTNNGNSYTMPPTAGTIVPTKPQVLIDASTPMVTVHTGQVIRPTVGTRPQNQNEAFTSGEAVYTGHLTPLQQPEVSNGNTNNAKITIKFPVNMLVPEGSSVLHKVYDGHDCSEGAKDITHMDNYVEAGLYSAGPAQRTTRNPAERMGLFLEWEPEHVQNSPLYTQWPLPDSVSRTDFNPAATLDLCVGLLIRDSQDRPQHYMETYVLTTWNGDDELQNVHMVPVTTDST